MPAIQTEELELLCDPFLTAAEAQWWSRIYCGGWIEPALESVVTNRSVREPMGEFRHSMPKDDPTEPGGSS